MLRRDEIARLIPHGGDMVLLDTVAEWTQTGIVCTTESHRHPDNPLRRDGRLGIACSIEYGMQAMAVHGSLIDSANNRPGFLASLRDVRFGACRLDDVAGELTVRAEVVYHQSDGVVYSFAIGSGNRELAVGRAAVFLR